MFLDISEFQATVGPVFYIVAYFVACIAWIAVWMATNLGLAWIFGNKVIDPMQKLLFPLYPWRWGFLLISWPWRYRSERLFREMFEIKDSRNLETAQYLVDNKLHKIAVEQKELFAMQESLRASAWTHDKAERLNRVDQAIAQQKAFFRKVHGLALKNKRKYELTILPGAQHYTSLLNLKQA